MQQAIHIFLKDARHWRWLIVLQFAMLAARTTMALGYIASGRSGWQQAPDYLDLLLPIVWWFLIALVVHDESLDATREFWITRPYSWRCLVAAKALFIALLILAPLLIADIVTLAFDHFSLRAYLPGLLWSECLRLLLLLPAALLASITAGLRQFLLGFLLLVLAVYTWAQFEMQSSVEGSSTLWFTLLLMAVPTALVIWQYAQRRTWLVRGIAAAAYLSSLIPTASSISDIGAPHPEIGIRFAPDVRLNPPFGSGRQRNMVEVAIPITISGRDRNLVEATLVTARIQSGGSHWQTHWDWYNNVIGTGSDWLQLTIPKRDFEQLKQGGATVQAEVAINVYDLESTTSLPTGGPWTSLGAAGQARLLWNRNFLGAERRMALYDPGYKLVYTLPTAVHTGYSTVSQVTSVGIYPRSISESHMSSVFFYGTNVANIQFGYVNVLVERPIGRVKRTLTIENVKLEDWVIGQ
jgi:hypothetical protein